MSFSIARNGNYDRNLFYFFYSSTIIVFSFDIIAIKNISVCIFSIDMIRECHQNPDRIKFIIIFMTNFRNLVTWKIVSYLCSMWDITITGKLSKFFAHTLKVPWVLQTDHTRYETKLCDFIEDLWEEQKYLFQKKRSQQR